MSPCVGRLNPNSLVASQNAPARGIKFGYADTCLLNDRIMSQKSLFFQSLPSKKRTKQVAGFIIPIVLVIIVLAALYGVIVWKWSYSSGERVGIVQKISNKGWICKTWEGELNMVVLPGGVPEKFFFTVWDEKVAASVNKTIGKRVSLHYNEKMGLPSSCFGDTRHYITKVVVLEP
jgi:hypothetical protein